MRTRDKLAAALRAVASAASPENAAKYEAFAKRAETGEFDDYADTLEKGRATETQNDMGPYCCMRNPCIASPEIRSRYTAQGVERKKEKIMPLCAKHDG